MQKYALLKYILSLTNREMNINMIFMLNFKVIANLREAHLYEDNRMSIRLSTLPFRLSN